MEWIISKIVDWDSFENWKLQFFHVKVVWRRMIGLETFHTYAYVHLVTCNSKFSIIVFLRFHSLWENVLPPTNASLPELQRNYLYLISIYRLKRAFWIWQVVEISSFACISKTIPSADVPRLNCCFEVSI